MGSITNFPYGLSSFGIPLLNGGMPGADPSVAGIYFVDGNSGNDGNSGLSWDEAFKTVAKGLLACHQYQTKSANKAWARRSKLFIVGDYFEEDLTALAEKTDVIGCGQCDGFFSARIKGNHVIDSTKYSGCRLFNITFQDNDATGTILTIPTEQSGIVLDGCTFLSGTATVIGVLVTASSDFQMRNCKFQGSWSSSFSTAALSIGAGDGRRTIIENNTIENQHATGVGILVNIGRIGLGSFIRGNHLYTTAMAIDENSNTFACIDNRAIVGTAKAADTSVDISAALSVNNLVTGSDGTISVPPCNYGAQS
jgi:hypothetical protein